MSRRLVVELLTLAAAALAAFLIRSFVAAPYSIPSESMLPTLMVDDTLLVEKWRLGPARRLSAFVGRNEPELPARGDIVVFRAPPAGRQTYVKRLIGLPGDRVALRGGIVILNGKPIARWRIADFVERVTPNSPCRPDPGTRVKLESDDGGSLCRYPRFREMLPDGRAYPILDIADDDADDMPERTVPADRVFVLGDNRDRSADSRFPAKDGGAVGMVPIKNLIGRARIVLFSTDGRWRWTAPSTGRAALRRERIGKPL
ncbi:signal peptidase I [Sphingomonas sp. BIUV-7]|uniref:Signal peptidase I n=1 Tax=Sphingomonas natans TaxID=3063330 RepID=A0ABT8Y3Y4_9SPHN|nr:signal peptidase I [Sphingomonas sp. BIUV-7]MDO6413027.1 signal peptidase I [Sphingomonas sp. BIUV-7]